MYVEIAFLLKKSGGIAAAETACYKMEGTSEAKEWK